MEIVGLPQLYIGKLGHNIEEIRVRALNQIIFKLEHNLITSKELALNSEFIKQLLRWFDFEPIKEQGKIINLLLELITENKDAGRYWQYIGVSDHLRSVKRKLSSNHRIELDKILQLLVNSENTDCKVNDGDVPAAVHERSVETESSPFAAFFEEDAYNDELQQLSCTLNHSKTSFYKRGSICHSKVLWFPMQPLSPGDFHILSSVEHSLSLGLDKHMQGIQGCSLNGVDKSDIDHEDTLIRCCQFVFDVILRDFLPEVFLQQPGIASTLLDLLSFFGNELEPDFSDGGTDGKTTENLHWIVKCLHRLATSLHAQLLFYADPSIPSIKDNSAVTSSQNTSLMICPVEGNSKFKHQVGGKVICTDHLTILSDENVSAATRAAYHEGSYQFSLPYFCISVLFQTCSLLATHLSGSHSSVFQCLVSLSSVSIQLLTGVVDADMWVSDSPISAAVTGGITEIFRIIGESLLVYQDSVFQKKGNSFSGLSKCSTDSTASGKMSQPPVEADFDSYRLAYLQVLFLMRSFLPLAPREPALCRSSIPKELSQALVVAVFDPSLHLLFPEIHSDILRITKLVSPESGRVCELALNISESVKMGIKILKGINSSYADISKALVGLAFHESPEILKRCWEYCTVVDCKDIYSSNEQNQMNVVDESAMHHACRNSNKRKESVKSSTGDRSETVICDQMDLVNLGDFNHSKAVRTEINPKSSGQLQGDLTMRMFSADYQSHLEYKEANLSKSENRILIILKLLAHESCVVRREIYSICNEMVTKLLGTASAKDFRSRGRGGGNLQKGEWRLENLSFIWNKSVLTEIITHGASSTDMKIQHYAKDIILFILKSKTFVGDKIWNHIMEGLQPCLPLLQCFADSVTPLGKAITKMFDPDVSLSIGMDNLDVLRGNCRLLFNSENAVRGEAATRLAWVLSQENTEDRNKGNEVIINSWKNVKNRLPDRDTLATFGHSTLANAFVFSPQDHNLILRPYSYPTHPPNQSENIVQILSLIGKTPDGNISLSDARVCRSALNQLALMLEHNAQLHSTFVKNNGLDIVINIFQGSLVEDDHEHYPDCAMPVVTILKHIAHWNPKVRKELSQQEILYHCILRATVLFYNEKAFRYDAAHLFCLLLFNDYILLLQSCPTQPSLARSSFSDSMPSFNSLSVPYLLTQHIHLPFQCPSHWRTSHHSLTSPLSPSIMSERETPLPKGCTSWSGMEKYKESLPWQGLIRVHGSWEWHGREGLLTLVGKKKLPVVLKDKVDKELPFGFPPLLLLSSAEVSDLKTTDIVGSCQSLLFEIQNATTHASVEKALHRLRGYISLWNSTLSEDGGLIVKSPDVGQLPWNSTLGRFLSRSPASHKDSELLVQICSFLRTAGEGKAATQILETEDTTGHNHNWLEGLMQNPTTLQPLLCPFNPPFSFPDMVCFTQEAFDGCPSRRAVCREVLSLIRELAGKGKMVDGVQEVGWAYAIYFIAQSLQFGDAEHFYDLAFLEWALSCLVQLTGRPGWGHGVNKIKATINKKKPPDQQIILWEGLISGLIELLTAFHHGGQPLPNWASEEGRTELSEKGVRNITTQRSAMPSSNQVELLSAENLEVNGSFMGLSITRSALLCLNHVLSEMQDACTQPSQDNWEIIWSKVLMNVGRNEQRGHLRSLWHETLQGWLLPLWSSRDPIVRAAALKLAGGLAGISSPASVPTIGKNGKKIQRTRVTDEPPLGLRLLEEGFEEKSGGVWGTVLSLLLDHCECNLVREHAALLLSNLVAASEKIPEQAISVLFEDRLLFKEIGMLASQLFIGHSLPQPVFSSSACAADGMPAGDVMAWSTPGLLRAGCQFLQNIMTLKPSVVSSAMWESNGFLFRRLFGCLGRIPIDDKKVHMKTLHYVDMLGLYSEILSLLTSVMVWDSRLVSLLPQPNPLTSVFLLLESDCYKTGNEFEGLKNEVWKKVFGFTSATLGSIIDQHGKSFLGSTAAIVPEKSYLVLLEAAYDSIVGNDLDLKKAALCSLNALFSLEIQHSICQAEGPESKKDDKMEISPLLQMLREICQEHGEMSERADAFTPKSLEDVNRKKNLTVKSESAFKLCHLLIHLYEPERVPFTEVSVTLSSLLALSVQVKCCALASGLLENLVAKGKQLHVSIVMGESEESLLIQPKLIKGVVNKKQQPKQWMKDMSLLFRLLTNFLHSGNMENVPPEISWNPHTNLVKLEAVNLGLSDVLHKLSSFAMLATSLMSDFLQLLTTFTMDCPSACQSLVYTSRTFGVGPRQNLASSSLLHLLCELASKETDSLLFLNLANQSKKTPGINLKQAVGILSTILATLKNACEVQECRMIMAKGILFQSIFKLHPNEKRNNQQLVETVEELWLSFLLHFTSYSEGQLSIPKIPDMFDLLLSLARKPTSKKETFLSVLRNLAFHPQNRARLLASDDFLQLLVQILNKADGSIWQKEVVGSTVWALSANNYKSKQILKGAGLENALKVGISFLWSVGGGVEIVRDMTEEDKKEENKIEKNIERISNVLKGALEVLGCEGAIRYSL